MKEWRTVCSHLFVSCCNNLNKSENNKIFVQKFSTINMTESFLLQIKGFTSFGSTIRNFTMCFVIVHNFFVRWNNFRGTVGKLNDLQYPNSNQFKELIFWNNFSICRPIHNALQDNIFKIRNLQYVLRIVRYFTLFIFWCHWTAVTTYYTDKKNAGSFTFVVLGRMYHVSTFFFVFLCRTSVVSLMICHEKTTRK